MKGWILEEKWGDCCLLYADEHNAHTCSTGCTCNLNESWLDASGERRRIGEDCSIGLEVASIVRHCWTGFQVECTGC